MMLATAPTPASIADQARRLTMSLSIGGRNLAIRGASRDQPSADGLHDKRLGLLVLGLALGEEVEDPARQDLLDRAVEGQRGELRRDVRAELAVGLAALDDRADARIG